MDIVSCHTRTAPTREELAAKHGAGPAATLDEVLSDPEVEAVLVGTPHSTRADMVVKAAGAGKHVFVDKPFTLTVAEAKRAIRGRRSGRDRPPRSDSSGWGEAGR